MPLGLHNIHTPEQQHLDVVFCRVGENLFGKEPLLQGFIEAWAIARLVDNTDRIPGNGRKTSIEANRESLEGKKRNHLGDDGL